MYEDADEVEAVEAKLDRIARDVAYLAERQRRIEELITELAPVGKLAMGAATEELAALEERGWFRFGKAAVRVADKVVGSADEAALEAFVANVGHLVETTRVLTQPAMLDVLADAGAVVQNREQLEPVTAFGAMRSMSEPEVQRGLAVLFELLRHLGRAADTLHGRVSPAPAARALPGTGSSGRYARRPAAAPAPAPAAAASAPRATPSVPTGAACKPTPPGPVATTVDGVAFTADGFLADPTQWTPALRDRLAQEGGIELTDAHLSLIDFAREDWSSTGSSPNIRRLSTGSGVSTRDIYTLFKKAPGKTVARLAGIPKPAGCI